MAIKDIADTVNACTDNVRSYMDRVGVSGLKYEHNKPFSKAVTAYVTTKALSVDRDKVNANVLKLLKRKGFVGCLVGNKGIPVRSISKIIFIDKYHCKGNGERPEDKPTLSTYVKIYLRSKPDFLYLLQKTNDVLFGFIDKESGLVKYNGLCLAFLPDKPLPDKPVKQEVKKFSLLSELANELVSKKAGRVKMAVDYKSIVNSLNGKGSFTTVSGYIINLAYMLSVKLNLDADIDIKYGTKSKMSYGESYVNRDKPSYHIDAGLNADGHLIFTVREITSAGFCDKEEDIRYVVDIDIQRDYNLAKNDSYW